MGYHQYLLDNVYDLDASFLPNNDNNLFNIEKDNGDNYSKAIDLDIDEDLGDADLGDDYNIPLYGGNMHPPDYYQRRIENPPKRECYICYALKTRLCLIKVEEQ
jgi:hypothetical protein